MAGGGGVGQPARGGSERPEAGCLGEFGVDVVHEVTIF